MKKKKGTKVRKKGTKVEKKKGPKWQGKVVAPDQEQQRLRVERRADHRGPERLDRLIPGRGVLLEPLEPELRRGRTVRAQPHDGRE